MSPEEGSGTHCPAAGLCVDLHVGSPPLAKVLSTPLSVMLTYSFLPKALRGGGGV